MKNKKWIALLSMLLAFGSVSGAKMSDVSAKVDDINVQPDYYAENKLFSYGQNAVTSEMIDTVESVSYYVEYYFEDNDGVFVLDETKSYAEQGFVGQVVSANAIELDEYELNPALSTISTTLKLSNNVLRVYYSLRRCDFSVKYYFEDVSGEFIEKESESYESRAIINKTVSANLLPEKNYEVNTALSTLESVVYDGAELRVYYSLKSYPYAVRYYFENDGEYEIDESKTQTLFAKFGQTITVNAPTIAGYELNASVSKDELTIKEKNNVIYLYYAIGQPSEEKTLSYSVEYYLEQSDGSFVIDNANSYTAQGLAGQTVSANPLQNDNYVLEPTISTTQKELLHSHNLLRAYYTLKEYDYTVKYYFKEGNSSEYEENELMTRVGKAKYQTTVRVNPLQIDGYTYNEAGSTVSCVINNDKNELAFYYDKNESEVFDFTVNIYYEKANAVGYTKTLTQKITATTLESILEQNLGAKEYFDFYRYDCNESSNGYILHLYYKRETINIGVEYFFGSDGNWVKNDALSQSFEIKYGSEFTTPIHNVYQNRIVEEMSTLYVSEVLSSDTICVYYGQEKRLVQITDVCALSSQLGGNYEEVIASNFNAKIYNETDEFEVNYEAGKFSASLIDGEYEVEITSPAFVDKYKAKIIINRGEVVVEPISYMSTLALNNGGTTTLDYIEDYDVWVNNGQDASSLSYITATASADVAVSITVSARHVASVKAQNWKDSEHAVGVNLISSSNSSNAVFVGVCKNGVKVKANGYTSYVTNNNFNNFTQTGSQSSESTLSVARLSSGEIYIYRDGIYLGWISADGWCNGVKFSDNWQSYLGEKSFVATGVDAPSDYKEFVFSNVSYSFSNSVVEGFNRATYTFKASDKVTVNNSTIDRFGSETLRAKVDDGKVLKAIIINDDKYLNATLIDNNVTATLVINPLKGTSTTNAVTFVYENEDNAVEVAGKVDVSDWIQNSSSKKVKLVSETGITYEVKTNEEGVYKTLVPKGKYFVYAIDGNYISTKQTYEIRDNTMLNLLVDEYDLSRYSYSGQDDLVWLYEDENSIALNGRINSQKVDDIFAQSYSGNFAYSIDMIQAWNNPQSKYNTSDDVTGILLKHSTGKYLGFYVESSNGRIRVVSGNGSWGERLNITVNADLYRKFDETSHNLSVVKNNGAIYFLIDGKIMFSFNGQGIKDKAGQTFTAYESVAHSSGKTTFEILNDTVSIMLSGGSVTAGLGSGFNNAVVNTIDRTGYKNAIITENQEVIDSLLVVGYDLKVIKDKNAIVTIKSDGYDSINGVVSQGATPRILIETKDGYTLDYVSINGADVYLTPYSKVYSIELSKIDKDIQIRVGTKEVEEVIVTGRLSGSANYEKAVVRYYADSVVYTTTPNSDGAFSINAKGGEGSLQVVFVDGKVRNLELEIQDGNCDVGEISPVETKWSHKEMSIEATMDVVASDDNKYIFAIGTSERSSDKKGHFYVYSVEENKVVASLEENLGNCRQIAYENGYCYVTARDDGMWVIDVTDYGCNSEVLTPETKKAEIVYHYDSVEMATGIIAHDSTVFIANRQYGVEVVDVSNPLQPKFVTNIQTGEVQSLDVHGDMLFAGIWGHQQVLVVDISDINHAKNLYTIPLDGRGDGVFYEDGFLYAATGHHARGDYSTTSSPAWGLGNGLEVFKVDKTGYEKIFGIKFDKGYEEGLDTWRVSKAGNYIYVTNTFNGTYIYDVTDIYNPVQVEHLHCDKTTSNVNNAVGVTTIDGSMFVAGARNGLFRYDNPDIKAPMPNSIRRGEVNKQSKIAPTITASGLVNYELVETQGQVRSIVVTDKYVLTANGNAGINVYDKENNELINNINTGYIIKELQIDGNYLYSAEDAGGLAVYDLNSIQNAGTLPLYRYDAIELGKIDNVKLGQAIRCNNSVAGHPLSLSTSKSVTTTAISEIRIANYEGKKYMLMHAGGTYIYIADVTDVADVKVIYKCAISSALMYARNFTQTTIEGKYFVVSANSFGFAYFNIDGSGVARNSDNSDYLYHNAWRTNTTASKLGIIDNGITAVNMNGEDKVLFVTGHGYRILDRETPSIYDNPIYGNVSSGWPVIYDNLLIVSHRIGGTVSIYDISDITNPKNIAIYKTNTSPDLAMKDGNKVYVPLGNYGFMIINVE